MGVLLASTALGSENRFSYGWNLGASPYPSDVSVEKGVMSLEGCFEYMFSFYNGSWKSYNPSKIDNSMYEISPYHGYWIKVNCSEVIWQIVTLTEEVVADGGFEGGSPSAAWDEFSTNFDTPICDVATCGDGSGTGPRTGTYWVWLGGADNEQATMTQNVTIPAGTAELIFWLEIPACDSGGAWDTFRVFMDGDMLYNTDSNDPFCDYTGYTQRVIDVSAYADGSTHSLQFRGDTDISDSTNFMVDDVSIVVTT